MENHVAHAASPPGVAGTSQRHRHSPAAMTRRPAWLSAGWWLAGAALMLFLASRVAWGTPGLEELRRAGLLMAGCLGAYAVTVISTRRMARVDIGNFHPLMGLAITLVTFGAVSAGLLFARTYYSRGFLLTAMAVTAAWLIIGRVLKQRLFQPTFAVEAGALPPSAPITRDARYVRLDAPSLGGTPVDAVIGNLETDDPQWQRFHAACQVSGIPVHNGPLVQEQVTGRVSLDYLRSGHLASFRPHPVYMAFKRGIDLLIVLASSPVILPVAGLAALAIKLDSPGPVFFAQSRVGEGGRRFSMVKFRSMHVDADRAGPRFAGEADDRITRVGHLIRRTRIDELPQFWNVIRGEMSVIGPRPEQVAFVEAFEQSIPFYAYRHLVKPGISGWAQVTHGYAASEDDTRDKLEYDLYYVRYCSIWLDLVTIFRTFRTIVTGDGAR